MTSTDFRLPISNFRSPTSDFRLPISDLDSAWLGRYAPPPNIKAEHLHARQGEAMQFNLFDWIREGVKRSVILGVHDAVEAIGPADEEARARLAALLPPVEGATAGPALAAGAKRKRLGRSLRDFDGAEE